MEGLNVFRLNTVPYYFPLPYPLSGLHTFHGEQQLLTSIHIHLLSGEEIREEFAEWGRFSTVQQSTVYYSTALYLTALYCIVLYCCVLYCNELLSTSRPFLLLDARNQDFLRCHLVFHYNQSGIPLNLQNSTVQW